MDVRSQTVVLKVHKLANKHHVYTVRHQFTSDKIITHRNMDSWRSSEIA
jgi:hypothetical protein